MKLTKGGFTKHVILGLEEMFLERSFVLKNAKNRLGLHSNYSHMRQATMGSLNCIIFCCGLCLKCNYKNSYAN